MPGKVTDEEFIKLWKRLGSPLKVMNALGLKDARQIYIRRRRLESLGHHLPSFAATQKSVNTTPVIPESRGVMHHEIKNGQIFVASDCHYWPDIETVAHKAFVKLIGEMKPSVICLNGDVFDGARISRHEPLYGENPPTVKREIEACQDRLSEIANASKNAKKYWTFGNHDIRLHRYLTANAIEVETMNDLFDFFPGWNTTWRLDINHSTVIKHRWHNGVHATYNNALKSMLNLNQGSAAIVTGHLHRLMINVWRGYGGAAYGVDSGTLAEPGGEQFAYLEGNPTPWASGFAILTFKDGKLLPPELCEVSQGVAYFRGKEV